MLSIGSHPLQSVCRQLTQRTDVFIFTSQNTHFKGFLRHLLFGLTPPERTLPGDLLQVATRGDQSLFRCVPHLIRHQDTCDESALVEVGVGDGHKETVGDEPVDLWDLYPQCSQADSVVRDTF